PSMTDQACRGSSCWLVGSASPPGEGPYGLGDVSQREPSLLSPGWHEHLFATESEHMNLLRFPRPFAAAPREHLPARPAGGHAVPTARAAPQCAAAARRSGPQQGIARCSAVWTDTAGWQRRVAYPRAADNVSGPLLTRLRGINQPVIRTG